MDGRCSSLPSEVETTSTTARRIRQEDPDWFYQCLTVDDTGVFTQSQLDKILAQLRTRWGDDMGEAIFRQGSTTTIRT